MTPRRGKLNHPKNEQSPSHKLRASLRRAKRSHKEIGNIKIQQHLPEKVECHCDYTEFQGFDVPPLKPSIRVLSLFDGISAALYILDKLKLHVGVYYSSEVDCKALQLQQHRFGDRIRRLGSVLNISEATLESLGPISLLIGGNPCTDLSLLNPRRCGLKDSESSGKLFYEFVRIKNYLSTRALSSGTPFFWVFENSFHMETDTRLEMSRALGCSPVMKNACDHLPVHQKHLFWHNIPQRDGAADTIPRPLQLDEILPPNRKPNVSVVPTLTTMSSAQRSGKVKILPVLEDGIPSSLYITEVEALFGFTNSFTDGPNLTLTDRQKLLGKSFCVPVVQQILLPLTDLFWVLP